MANPEHVEILKQGVEVWNRWRRENASATPDLRDAELESCYLVGINLSYADLFNSNMSRSELIRANFNHSNLASSRFCHSNLKGATLADSDLTNADFSNSWVLEANLMNSNLSHAHFHAANLNSAKLRNTNLERTNFFRANLCNTDLSYARFEGTSFQEAKLGWTIFVDADFRGIHGLAETRHIGPSSISIDSFYRSHGEIPEYFLAKAGIPYTLIEYMASFTGKAFNLNSCFISYSSKDQDFSDRLYADLQNKGVRCWFATEDMKIGDKIWDRIDQSIRLHDKLLLVLSEHSINSEWIEDEVEAAYEQEQKRGKIVLFPIKLDGSVMDTDKSWASRLRRSRHIGDFTKWKDNDSYEKAFDRLLRDLKAEKE